MRANGAAEVGFVQGLPTWHSTATAWCGLPQSTAIDDLIAPCAADTSLERCVAICRLTL